MRTCPSCGRFITDATTQLCPNCGATLAEYSSPPPQDQPVGPAYGAPPTQPPYGSGYGPGYGPGYGAPSPLSQPMAPYPPAVAYGPNEGQPSQQPVYVPGGQPQPPAQPPYGTGYGPAYGQPQPPYAPAYGAPTGYPGAFRPGADWQPGKQPSRPPWGRIFAGVVGALVVIAIVVSVYNQSRPTRPLSGASESATATANAITTFLSDPLTTNANGWPDDANHCYFAQDGYHVRNAEICYAPIGNQTDGTESVTVKEVSGPTNHGYGLVFRRASKGNYYFFGIDSNSEWVAAKTVNDNTTTLQDYTHSDVIKGGLNTENALSVTMTGSTFDCYVNGQKVGTIHDSTFAEGEWGVAVYSTDNVVFTNYLARA